MTDSDRSGAAIFDGAMRRKYKRKLAIAERERLLVESGINLAGAEPGSPEYRKTLRELAEMLSGTEFQSVLSEVRRARDADRHG